MKAPPIVPWLSAAEAASCAPEVLSGMLQATWRDYCNWARDQCQPGAGTSSPRVLRRRLRMYLGLAALAKGLPEDDHIRFHQQLLYGTVVTSPLLIAALAVQVCEDEDEDGAARRFHDISDAESAFRYLNQLPGIDPALITVIVRLVALKNLVRNAIGADKEVVVWRAGRIEDDNECVTEALGRYLAPLASTSPGMFEALAALVAALESRAGGSTRNRQFMDQYRHLLSVASAGADPGSANEAVLVAVEYAHHALPVPADRRDQFGELAGRAALSHSRSELPRLLWVSADRFFAGHQSQDFPKRLRLAEHLAEFALPMIDPLAALFDHAHAALHFLDVPPELSFRLVFDMPPPPGGVWAELAAVFAAQPPGPISLGFVLFACEVMRNLRPLDFFELRFTSERVPSPLAKTARIFLPREAPPLDGVFAGRLEKWTAGAAESHALRRDAHLLVAASAAAMVPNRSLFFGVETQQVMADAADDVPRNAWYPVLKRLRHAARHDVINDYLRVVSDRPLFAAAQRPTGRVVTTDRPLAIGCDVGATSVKVALYEVRGPQLTIVRRMDGEPSMRTQPRDGARYADAADFASRVETACRETFGGRWPELRARLVAIGVAWPGAVAGPPGEEEVAAPSKILCHFASLPSSDHWKATADQLRALALRQAFEQAFGGAARPLVRLVNDGTCHVVAGARDFQDAVSGIGETVAALTVGTTIALKFYDVSERRALEMLSEVGRMIIEPAEPPKGDYPGGTASSLMQRDSLGRLATELLDSASSNTNLPPFAAQAQELTFTIGWLLSEADGADRAEAERMFEHQWAAWRPECSEPVEGLPALRARLRRRLSTLGRWPDEFEFAQSAARRMGTVLAEIVASVAAITDPRTYLIGGGPLSGSTGKFVREATRQILRTRFNFHVERDMMDSAGGPTRRRARVIRIPEPSRPASELGPSGCLGAALLACEVLAPVLRPAVVIPPPSHAGARPGFVALPRLSAYSVIEFGDACPGDVVFPGRSNVPPHCHGYVRSSQREERARLHGKHPQALPWRDYPDSVLTPAEALAGTVRSGHAVLLSARNTLNEAFYACRIAGTWYRRTAEHEVLPEDWPVLVLGSGPAHLARLDSVGADGSLPDLVAGVPVVVNGEACSRAFLMAHSSDVAHVWDVDPKGRRGTPRTVWQALSDRWQQGIDSAETPGQIEQGMRQIANQHGVRESQHLLHSLVAQRRDGTLFAFAMTAALRQIGRTLVERWDVVSAILLDNGGSVGWMTIEPGHDQPTIVVAGPNYRPRGTAFIIMHTGRFLHPQAHAQIAPLLEVTPDGAHAA